MSDPTLTLTDVPSPEVRAAIVGPLVAFNNARTGYADASRALIITLTDSDDGRIVGGLWGATNFDYLRVDLFFIPEASRRSGLGRRVLTMAEAEARERGCHGVWLDTYTFQAPGFYKRMGYEVFGTIPDYPPGHSRFFLRKALAP